MPGRWGHGLGGGRASRGGRGTGGGHSTGGGRGYRGDGRGNSNVLPPSVQDQADAAAAAAAGAFARQGATREDNNMKRPTDVAEGSGLNKGTVAGKKSKGVLCFCICDEEHLTLTCPLLHAPRPAAMFCGFAGDHLGFF